MLALVIADAYIPERQTEIPHEFVKLMSSGKIDQVISLGNVNKTPATAFISKISTAPVAKVMGESDISHLELETKRVFSVGERRIGLVSGFEITPSGDIDVLTAQARDMNVDILLWAGTHTQELDYNAGHVFINPGSLTGAPNLMVEDMPTVPGFCLLDIQDKECTAFMYKYENSKVHVEKAKLPI